MQGDDVVSAGAPNEAACKLFRGGRPGVVSSKRPRNDRQTQFPCGAREVPGLEAHRRAEQAGELASNVGDDFLRLGKLVLPVRKFLVDAEMVVVERVIPDDVAFIVDAADEAGMFA